MGVNPTLPNYKSFTFDGVSSRKYGVYITGKGVFNAPERNVELVDIPGRNGAYALDKGNFNNIEVTYPAGIVANTAADFAEAVSNMRNYLCSKTSYVRLTDDYNPDEYRLAIYKSGLDVDHEGLINGTFDLVFECKPQRYLTSGEYPVAITGTWGTTQSKSGSIVTIDNDDLGAGAKSLVADINPIQDLSHGDPSPSNICPISGRSNVYTYVRGKNLIPNSATTETKNGLTFTVNADGSVKVTGTASADTACYMIPSASLALNAYLASGQTYILSGCPSGGGSSKYALQLMVNGSTWYEDYGNGKTFTYSPTSGNALVRITIKSGQALGTSGITFYPMIRLSSVTDSTFEAYNGNTYTTSLGTTVYGGTLDVVSGVLTVDRVMLKVSDLSWEYDSAMPRFISATNLDLSYLVFPTDQNVVCDSISSAYKAVKQYGFGSEATGSYMMSTGKRVSVKDTRYTTVSAFTSNMGNEQFVFKLATPTTTTLTKQQVMLLLGTNNIWANSGDVAIQYGHDPYVLTNPTPFDSKPLIQITGVGTLTVGNYSIVITGTSSQVLYIDCDNMEAYKYSGGVPVNANSLISFNSLDFPTLKSGNNRVGIGTGLSNAIVTPKWWRV